MTPIWRGPIPATNYAPGRAGQVIQGIIIHTMVTTLSGADATFHDPNRIASAHYGIRNDGAVIFQWVDEADTAYHCGRLAPDSFHPLANTTTIGIEHDDLGRPFDPRPDALYAASAVLVAELCARYAIPIDRDHIRKHSEVSIAPTGCPDALDIDRIVRQAQGGSMFDQNDRATLIKQWVGSAAAGLGIVLTDTEVDIYRLLVHDNLDNQQSVLAKIKADHPASPATGFPTQGTISGTIELK